MFDKASTPGPHLLARGRAGQPPAILDADAWACAEGTDDARSAPERTRDERVDDIERILEAMRLAVREALFAHKRAGNPIAVWRNERVEWIQPEDIVIDDVPEREQP